MRLRLLVISIFLFTCAKIKETDNKENNCLPDNLFVSTNFKESMSVDDVPREDRGRRCYFKSKQLKQMDSLQIVELLFPFLGDHFKPSYWVADFVAKQEKHGELQPIIVRVEGFEYLTLWYLLLDRDCNLKGY